MDRFKILGNAPEEEKAKAKKTYEDRLHNHAETLVEVDKENFRKFEYPKTEKELKVISLINKETNRLLEEVGVKPFDVSSDNFHIVPPEIYKKVRNKEDGSSASTSFEYQLMIFDAEKSRDNSMNFLADSLHELLHLKAHTSIQVDKDNEKIKSHLFREGMGIGASAKKIKEVGRHTHFNGLHEAIVATQEKKSFCELVDNPIFEEERRMMELPESIKAKKKVSEKTNIPEDEFMWIDTNKKKFFSFGYLSIRKTLDYVLEEIQKEFSEKYASKDEVFKEFLKAHLQGGLLTIARLVEDTFGKGGFRLLGNMEKNDNSATMHLETLRQERNRFLKSKEKK
jgi:hypothetical protein